MTKMRRALAGIAFTAMLAFSLTATQGTAWAAMIEARDGVSVDAGRGTTPPKNVLPPSGGGTFNSLGVTWED